MKQRLHFVQLVMLLGLLFLNVAGSAAQDAELVRHFDYDRKAPLNIKDVGAQRRARATIYGLTYASPNGGVVPAYLVVPKGRGPFAAVIWAHWCWENSSIRNRKEFLDEALLLPQAGVVSLLPDALVARPGYVGRFVRGVPERSSQLNGEPVENFASSLTSHAQRPAVKILNYPFSFERDFQNCCAEPAGKMRLSFTPVQTLKRKSSARRPRFFKVNSQRLESFQSVETKVAVARTNCEPTHSLKTAVKQHPQLTGDMIVTGPCDQQRPRNVRRKFHSRAASDDA